MYLQTTKNNIDYSNIYKGGSGPSENRSFFTNQKIGNAPQKRSKSTNEFSELLKKIYDVFLQIEFLEGMR